MTKVLSKLAQARLVIQGKKLNKSGENKHLGFNYYELGDILPTVNEVFSELGLLGQFCIIGEIPFANASLTIYDTASGESVKFESPTAQATLVKATPVQELGAVHTYLKRYLYLNALELVEPDVLDKGLGDKDTVNGGDTKATKKQIDMISELLNGKQEHIDYTCEQYKVKTLQELTMKQASEVISKIKAKQGK